MAMIATEANESRLVPVPGRVLGIDPGLNVTGYAVVEPSPRGPFVVEAGVIRPRSASRGHGPTARLHPSRRSSRFWRRFLPARSPSNGSTAMCAIRAPRS